MSGSPFGARFDAVRARAAELGVDAVLVSVGADLPWLCGYEAMPLERLTMLVVPRDGEATLVVPGLEAPRVVERPEFGLRPWGETEDPIAIVADLVRGAGRVAVGDRTWARFVIDLAHALPGVELRKASEVTGPLRARKDDHEVVALCRAGAAADVVARAIQAGEIGLVGRTEADVSAEIGRRLVDEGHQRVNFAIVAAGENAASPHHEPGERRIAAGEGVLFDFGGTMHDEWGVGYCSDITRCVWLGEPPAEAAEAYAALHASHAAGVAAAQVGTPCQDVDRAARAVLVDAGLGEWFVHRTGHGIGVEEHEDPYLVEGNDLPLEVGHAFSIEPGVYLPGRFGFRLEDCLAAAAAGPVSFTAADRDLRALG